MVRRITDQTEAEGVSEKQPRARRTSKKPAAEEKAEEIKEEVSEVKAEKKSSKKSTAGSKKASAGSKKTTTASKKSTKARKQPKRRTKEEIWDDKQADEAVKAMLETLGTYKTKAIVMTKKTAKRPSVWATALVRGAVSDIFKIGAPLVSSNADGEVVYDTSNSALSKKYADYDEFNAPKQGRGAKGVAGVSGDAIDLTLWFMENKVLADIAREFAKMAGVKSRSKANAKPIRVSAGGSYSFMRSGASSPTKVIKDNLFVYLGWLGKDKFNNAPDAENIIKAGGIPQDVTQVFATRWARAREGNMKKWVIEYTKLIRSLKTDAEVSALKGAMNAAKDEKAKLAVLEKNGVKAADLKGEIKFSIPAMPRYKLASDSGLAGWLMKAYPNEAGKFILGSGLTKDEYKDKAPNTDAEKLDAMSYKVDTSAQAMLNKVAFDVVLSIVQKASENMRADKKRKILPRHVGKALIDLGEKVQVVFQIA